MDGEQFPHSAPFEGSTESLLENPTNAQNESGLSIPAVEKEMKKCELRALKRDPSSMNWYAELVPCVPKLPPGVQGKKAY